MIVVGFIAGALGLGLGWFVVGIIWAFIYNKMYTTRLIEQGYKLADTAERNAAAKLALGLGDEAVMSVSPQA